MMGTLTIKLIVGMIGIIFYLRVTGKTQMSGMTPLDSVNSIVLGAIIGGVMYSPGTSVWMLVFAILAWTAFTLGMRYLLRWNRFNRLFNGRDEVLMRDGEVNLKAFARNNLDIDQFRTKLREMDITSMKDIKEARLETDGQLTVFKHGSVKDSYLLIRAGEVIEDEMKDAGLTKKWLDTEIGKLGYKDFKDIFAAEWTPSRGFYVIGRDGRVTDKNLKEDPRDKQVNKHAQKRKRKRKNPGNKEEPQRSKS